MANNLRGNGVTGSKPGLNGTMSSDIGKLSSDIGNVTQAASDAVATAKQTLSDAKDAGAEIIDQVGGMTAERPFRSVLIAFGVGCLVSFLLGRSSKD
jgi:ElaB/YqjD/DUF883 family membrane-anchored ribosome-binding protein